jgi:hypothetical protein
LAETDISTRLRPAPLSLPAIIAWSLALACIYTLLSGYAFGASDPVEQLPLIERALDPSFCPTDFYVNASQEFSPRTYYVMPLAALGRVIPLHLLIFGLTILGNAAIVFVTFFAARDLIGGGDLVPMIACTIMVAVSGVAPGGAAQLVYREVVPGTLAMPLLLLALWAALRGRFAASAACALAGSVFHPLLGIMTGAVAIFGAAVAVAWRLLRPTEERPQLRRSLIAAALSLAGFLLLSYLLWFRGYSQELDAREFIDILVRFRAPHHYLPSAFAPLRMIDLFAFFIAMAISLRWFRRRQEASGAVAGGVVGIVASVMLLLLGGWFFVEVVPIRAFAAAQAFRFVFIIKWLGLLLFAGTIAHAWRTEERSAGAGWIIFASHGGLHGSSVLVGHAVELLRRRLSGRLPVEALALLTAVGLSVATGLWLWQPEPWEAALLAVFATLALLVLAARREWLRIAMPIASVILLVALLQVNATMHLPFVGAALRQATPKLTMERTHPEMVGVTRFAREATEPDALFIGPPASAHFRLMARRSLVIDLKCIPFSDAGLLEWYRRIHDSYGPLSATGFYAWDEAEERWQQVSDVRLRALAGAYGANYAVLHATTPTELPEVYSDAHWRVVSLSGGE